MSNPLKALGHAFAGIGHLVGKGLHAAQEAGLTDEILALALPYVRKASAKYVDNDKRREWVVAALVAQKVPESVARIGTELAFRLYKAEAAKVGV